MRGPTHSATYGGLGHRSSLRRLGAAGSVSLGCVLVASLLVQPACSNSTAPPSPASFDRPDSLAFFCWDLDANVVTSLDRCVPDSPATIDEDLGQPREGFALHVFVAQTSSGELAAVRLTGENGEAGVIDGDVRIPGYTFAAVGEVPSAVVTSPTDPKHVYVLSRGSGLVESFETAAFRKGQGTRRTASVELPLGSRPNAMLLTPDQSALVVALPDSGQIARVPLLPDGQLGDYSLLDLAVDIPAPVDLSGLPESELPPVYQRTCPREGLVRFQPTVLPPRVPTSLGVTPEPWELLFDPETDDLLVADRSLPIIHVVDARTETMVEAEPISVSVPTRALAITPRVPATYGATTQSERFLYAIDETDYSVLTIDLTDPARGSFRGVIPVNVSPPFDRLETQLPARALAVVSPTYDEALPIELTCETPIEGQTAAGVNLHGVFLSVATVDGRIRFFDIFDLDAACRGVDCEDLGAADPEDEIVAIGRHRPRQGAFLQDGVQISTDFSWNTDGGGSALVAADGTTRAQDLVPDFVPVTCEDPLSVVFPRPDQTGAPLICAITDPWAAISQRFGISYEGRIPFSGTSGANFDESSPTLEIRGDPCALGVLGRDNAPADGYLAGYAGDAVAITGDLPPSILAGDETDATPEERDRFDRCVSLTQRTTSGATTPIILPILKSWTRPDGIRDTYTGRLDLGPPAGFDNLDAVRECFPELLELEIRVQDAFVVESGRQGFLHSVVRADDGACTIDPELDAQLHRGRAFLGRLYRSPYITFQLGGAGAPAPPSLGRPNVEFTIGDVPTPLTIDTSSVGGSDRSSLLSRLLYNDVDERLYAVDQAVQGLMRIRLTNLTVQQTFR